MASAFLCVGRIEQNLPLQRCTIYYLKDPFFHHSKALFSVKRHPKKVAAVISANQGLVAFRKSFFFLDPQTRPIACTYRQPNSTNTTSQQSCQRKKRLTFNDNCLAWNRRAFLLLLGKSIIISCCIYLRTHKPDDLESLFYYTIHWRIEQKKVCWYYTLSTVQPLSVPLLIYYSKWHCGKCSRKLCVSFIIQPWLNTTSSPADKMSGRFWRRIKNPETSDTIKWLK